MDELKTRRKALGLTQEEAAKKAGINKATLNQIEQGKRQAQVSTLMKLADALNCEVRDFFPKGETPSPEFELDGEEGVHLERTASSHVGRITGSSHARAEVDVEALRAALHGVAAGWLTAEEAEEKLLAGAA
jgi:transcriptional regulator with XRE-family HTH domain